MEKKLSYLVFVKRIILLGVLLMVIVFIKQNAYAATVDTKEVNQVTGLKQTSSGSNYIELDWKVILGDNIRYEVYVSNSVDGKYFKQNSDEYSPNCYINNLNAGSTYYVKVRAYEYTYGLPNIYGEYSSVCKVVTVPSTNVKVSSIKQTKATETTITLQWSKVTGANRYYISYYKYGSSSKTAKTVSSNTNSITLKNLSKNGRYSVYIEAGRSSGTYIAKGYSSYMSDYINTLPTKITSVKCTDFYINSHSAYFSWKESKSAQGYQYIVYTYNGKTLTSGFANYNYTNITKSKLVTNKFYKIKVRGYINLDCGKKYGTWSSYQYFTGDNSSVKLSKSSGKLKTTWKKCSGATSYSIYVSTSRPNYLKNMKKVKTVSSSKLSYTLTKFKDSKISTKKTYYVYVCANRKVGSATYSATPYNCMYK